MSNEVKSKITITLLQLVNNNMAMAPRPSSSQSSQLHFAPYGAFVIGFFVSGLHFSQFLFRSAFYLVLVFLSILAEAHRQAAVFSCTKTLFFVFSSSNKNPSKAFAILSKKQSEFQQLFLFAWLISHNCLLIYCERKKILLNDWQI